MIVHPSERIARVFAQCRPRDVEGFFTILGKMSGADDLRWIERLQAVKE